MNRQDRALRKELLLLKGEALRMRMVLELAHWRKPLHAAAEGAALLRGLPRLKAVLGIVAVLLPSTRLRGLLKWGTKITLLVQLLSRVMRKA
jgi:hypothetical protein